MQSLENTHVLSQFAAERAMQLRRTALRRDLPRRPMRRRVGEQLVRLGTWVAAEPKLATRAGPIARGSYPATSLRSVPIPSISDSTTSPAARNRGGVRAKPDARWCPGEDHVAGLEGQPARQLRDNPRDAEVEIVKRRGLDRLAVDATGDRALVGSA